MIGSRYILEVPGHLLLQMYLECCLVIWKDRQKVAERYDLQQPFINLIKKVLKIKVLLWHWKSPANHK